MRKTDVTQYPRMKKKTQKIRILTISYRKSLKSRPNVLYGITESSLAHAYNTRTWFQKVICSVSSSHILIISLKIRSYSANNLHVPPHLSSLLLNKSTFCNLPIL